MASAPLSTGQPPSSTVENAPSSSRVNTPNQRDRTRSRSRRSSSDAPSDRTASSSIVHPRSPSSTRNDGPTNAGSGGSDLARSDSLRGAPSAGSAGRRPPAPPRPRRRKFAEPRSFRGVDSAAPSARRSRRSGSRTLRSGADVRRGDESGKGARRSRSSSGRRSGRRDDWMIEALDNAAEARNDLKARRASLRAGSPAAGMSGRRVDGKSTDERIFDASEPALVRHRADSSFGNANSGERGGSRSGGSREGSAFTLSWLVDDIERVANTSTSPGGDPIPSGGTSANNRAEAHPIEKNDNMHKIKSSKASGAASEASSGSRSCLSQVDRYLNQVGSLRRGRRSRAGAEAKRADSVKGCVPGVRTDSLEDATPKEVTSATDATASSGKKSTIGRANGERALFSSSEPNLSKSSLVAAALDAYRGGLDGSEGDTVKLPRSSGTCSKPALSKVQHDPVGVDSAEALEPSLARGRLVSSEGDTTKRSCSSRTRSKSASSKVRRDPVVDNSAEAVESSLVAVVDAYRGRFACSSGTCSKSASSKVRHDRVVDNSTEAEASKPLVAAIQHGSSISSPKKKSQSHRSLDRRASSCASTSTTSSPVAAAAARAPNRDMFHCSEPNLSFDRSIVPSSKAAPPSHSASSSLAGAAAAPPPPRHRTRKAPNQDAFTCSEPNNLSPVVSNSKASLPSQVGGESSSEINAPLLDFSKFNSARSKHLSLGTSSLPAQQSNTGVYSESSKSLGPRRVSFVNALKTAPTNLSPEEEQSMMTQYLLSMWAQTLEEADRKLSGLSCSDSCQEEKKRDEEVDGSYRRERRGSTASFSGSLVPPPPPRNVQQEFVSEQIMSKPALSLSDNEGTVFTALSTLDSDDSTLFSKDHGCNQSKPSMSSHGRSRGHVTASCSTRSDRVPAAKTTSSNRSLSLDRAVVPSKPFARSLTTDGSRQPDQFVPISVNIESDASPPSPLEDTRPSSLTSLRGRVQASTSSKIKPPGAPLLNKVQTPTDISVPKRVRPPPPPPPPRKNPLPLQRSNTLSSSTNSGVTVPNRTSMHRRISLPPPPPRIAR